LVFLVVYCSFPSHTSSLQEIIATTVR
jgi:hypothetical protein